MQPFLLPIISKLTVRSVIDVLALAILIYQFVVIIRGRHAAHILTGLGVLLAVYLVAVWAHLDLLRTVLAGIAPYTAFALIVMFQSEIRRLWLSPIRHFRATLRPVNGIAPPAPIIALRYGCAERPGPPLP